jgi:hypothetical protein
MLNFLSLLSLKHVGLIIATIGAGWMSWSAYTWHTDKLEEAIRTTQNEIVLEQTLYRVDREKKLKIQSQQDLKVVEKSLKEERLKVTKLEQQLLIDHDLDRLLQRKPGLILIRVNKGTDKYFKDLKEATQ